MDAEIARAEQGDFVRLDPVGQRDRYQQFSHTARELLADFRQVEENFRRLDRNLRKQIAGWTGSKGALLDTAVGSRNSIAESDQGRNFQPFYDFLLSHDRQAELSDLLERSQSYCRSRDLRPTSYFFVEDVRKWVAAFESDATGRLDVEYRNVGGRNFGAHRIPARARLTSFEQVCSLLGTGVEVGAWTNF
jgi:Protein of unknown function (DUF3375)/Uncharacterized protein conserved in bacteria N-term (DUF3322)